MYIVMNLSNVFLGTHYMLLYVFQSLGLWFNDNALDICLNEQNGIICSIFVKVGYGLNRQLIIDDCRHQKLPTADEK